ncbi:MAG: zinc dependent phospholipase C family protein [Verrucomicrobiae bacterium]|nr:zinc dependent phospholipase C family protein [Verrucomicrobiae bacterium]
MKRSITTFVALSSLFFPLTGFAFKVDTHVWIAQEVLNDAIDGKISIPLNDRLVEIDLPERLVTALRNKPEFFRLGNLGPDAYPSVYLGQIIIHPGVEGNWGTSEWLMHLHANHESMSDEELAFTFGFFCHAAADVFCHTYVNRYTGDVFELTENKEVVARHIAIEALIAKHTPPLRNDQGRLIGLPGNLTRLSNGEPAAPNQFIFDTLLFNPDAIRVYESGRVMHIGLINDLRRSLDKIIAEGDKLEMLEKKLKDFIFEVTLEAKLSKEAADKSRELVEDIKKNTNLAADFWKVNREIAKFAKTLDQGAFEKADGLLEKAEKFESQINDFQNEAIKLREKVNKELKNLERLPRIPIADINKEIRERELEGCKRLLGPARKECEKRVNRKYGVVAGFDQARENQRRAIEKAIESARRGESEILTQGIPNRSKQMRDALSEALDIVIEFHDARIENADLLVEYFEENPGKNPLREYLENWRKDIDWAMRDYVTANGNTLIGSMPPKADDPLVPLKDWFDCRSKGIIGVPVVVQDGVCKVEGRYHNIREAFSDLETRIIGVAPGGDKFNRLRKEWEDFLEETRDELTDLAEEEIGKALAGGLGVDLYHIKQHIEGHVDLGSVNREFANDESGENLLVIPDAGNRIIAEMELDSQGYFDPENYSVARNSVLLAKLSLLDNKGLDELATKANVRSTIYGRKLWGKNSKYADNILFGFIRSIDGNHQWMSLAPPHPRKDGADWDNFYKRRGHTNDGDSIFRYGYPNWREGRGMRLWADRKKEGEGEFFGWFRKDARNHLFRAIFSGPLIPGIDAPELIGMREILPSNYPAGWIPSPENPYPDPPGGGIDFPERKSEEVKVFKNAESDETRLRRRERPHSGRMRLHGGR